MEKAILFDLDGTLWDSCAAIVPAWTRVLGRSVTEAEMRGFMGMTDTEAARKLMPDRPLSESLPLFREGCREEAADLYRTGGRLFPHVEETLTALSREYGLYIVSNCIEGYVPAFLHAHGLEAQFTDYAYLGSPENGKSANIRFICTHYGIEKAVYVGDMPSDQAAAREAGLPFIHAGYGFGSVTGADYEISDFAELTQAAAAVLS